MSKIKVREVQIFERPVRFRMPFRFGIVTLTEEIQTFIRLRLQSEDGREAWGLSAEVLGPKWFDKNPKLTNEENEEQLRNSLRIACGSYLAERGFCTPFELFIRSYPLQNSACARQGLNPLIAGYGPSLLDRAILDALCRSLGISFFQAIRNNLPGIYATEILPELSNFDLNAMLGGLRPGKTIYARHTVGLVDPIVFSDQAPSERLDDGLPETLEEVIAFYGNRYFKLKLCGNLQRDLDRLTQIAGLLDRCLDAYCVSLDGNEQYSEAAQVEELWAEMQDAAELKRLVDSVLFIEQPLNRNIALDSDVSRLSARKPVIIDESDVDLDAFPRARYQGYLGVSSKNCKGLYRSLINLARCHSWNAREGKTTYFMTGEDLTTMAGIAVQQDIALATILGLTHLERNGHHYVKGLAALPDVEQEAFLNAHPDLYVRDRDYVRLRIQHGLLAIGSLDRPGLGLSAEPDWSSMREAGNFK